MEDLKKYFEANHLDGDKIQAGQTFSSDGCFDAFVDGYNKGKEELEKLKNSNRKMYELGKKEEHQRILKIVKEYKEKGFEINTLIDRIEGLHLDDKFEKQVTPRQYD